jgi:hypothetical protein
VAGDLSAVGGWGGPPLIRGCRSARPTVPFRDGVSEAERLRCHPLQANVRPSRGAANETTTTDRISLTLVSGSAATRAATTKSSSERQRASVVAPRLGVAKVASELGVQGQLLGGIVPTHGPEEPLVPDMCWLTETVVGGSPWVDGARRRRAPTPGNIPGVGGHRKLPGRGHDLPSGGQHRVWWPKPLPIRPQRLQTAESDASSAGLLAVILCASTRAIRDAVTVIQCADGRWHDAPRAGLRSSRCYAPSVRPEERFSSSTGIVLMPAVRFA